MNLKYSNHFFLTMLFVDIWTSHHSDVCLTVQFALFDTMKTSWLTSDPCLWLGGQVYGQGLIKLISGIFWLNFCTAGGSEDESSIFMCRTSLANTNKTLPYSFQIKSPAAFHWKETFVRTRKNSFSSVHINCSDLQLFLGCIVCVQKMKVQCSCAPNSQELWSHEWYCTSWYSGLGSMAQYEASLKTLTSTNSMRGKKSCFPNFSHISKSSTFWNKHSLRHLSNRWQSECALIGLVCTP